MRVEENFSTPTAVSFPSSTGTAIYRQPSVTIAVHKPGSFLIAPSSGSIGDEKAPRDGRSCFPIKYQARSPASEQTPACPEGQNDDVST